MDHLRQVLGRVGVARAGVAWQDAVKVGDDVTGRPEIGQPRKDMSSVGW